MLVFWLGSRTLTMENDNNNNDAYASGRRVDSGISSGIQNFLYCSLANREVRLEGQWHHKCE